MAEFVLSWLLWFSPLLTVSAVGGIHQCNETQVRVCYYRFDANASYICTEVQRLKLCVEKLSGCHVMRHASFARTQKVLEDHSKCFVNYSIILQSLRTKKNTQRYQTTTQSSSVAPTNLTNSSALEEEPSASYLPYTFVVVATVCTCLFLIMLIIFSIVRHTMLMRHQQNSTIIEQPPTRIRIRSRERSRHRTRPYNYHHHRSNRRHMYVISGARETVTGFFEGNVAPPPYNCVLDDNESLRAGDPPPPYRPPSSCVAIGIIV